MLTTLPTIPHIVSGEVIGACGAKVWPMLPDGAECMHLWIAGAGMVGVQLDLAGVRALIGLLREIEQALPQP
jgi:hypothetical protein